MAIAVLIGHWLDLYVTIVPAHIPEPRLNGWEFALAFGTFAAVGWAVTKRDGPVVGWSAGLQPAGSPASNRQAAALS